MEPETPGLLLHLLDTTLLNPRPQVRCPLPDSYHPPCGESSLKGVSGPKTRVFTQNVPSGSTAWQFSLVTSGKWPPGLFPCLPICRFLGSQYMATVLLHVPGQLWGTGSGTWRAYMGRQQEGGRVEPSGLGVVLPVQSDLSSSLTLTHDGTTPCPPCVHTYKGQMNDQRACWPSHPTYPEVTEGHVQSIPVVLCLWRW